MSASAAAARPAGKTYLLIPRRMIRRVLSASKQCHSVSMSGPSAIANPSPENLHRRSCSSVIGCSPAPRGNPRQRPIDPANAAASRHPAAPPCAPQSPVSCDRTSCSAASQSAPLLLAQRFHPLAQQRDRPRPPKVLHPHRVHRLLIAAAATSASDAERSCSRVSSIEFSSNAWKREGSAPVRTGRFKQKNGGRSFPRLTVFRWIFLAGTGAWWPTPPPFPTWPLCPSAPLSRCRGSIGTRPHPSRRYPPGPSGPARCPLRRGLP